jgi:PleD family two-component response regulator
MPETTGEGAMLAAERLRKKIEEMQVDTSEGKSR